MFKRERRNQSQSAPLPKNIGHPSVVQKVNHNSFTTFHAFICRCLRKNIDQMLKIIIEGHRIHRPLTSYISF